MKGRTGCGANTPEEWSVEARKKPHAKNGDPDRRAKIAAAKRGVPRPWSVIKKLIDAKTGTKHTAEAKAKMSAAQKRRGTRPPKAGRAWTAEEDEAVRTMSPRRPRSRQGGRSAPSTRAGQI